MESATAPRADLLDPAVLASLGHLEVVARWIVDGFMSGLHRSPRRGFSVEFAEHRPYQPGDDLRYVDWRIAARSDRWVVKQFEEETNLRATLVLDVSRSMAWSGASLSGHRDGTGTPWLTKLAYAEQLTAALALLLLRQRDAVGLVAFDEVVRSSVPPRARTGQWRRILASLAGRGEGRTSNAPRALEAAARLVNRRGMVVLISDLLFDPRDAIRAIRGLRAAGHDVTVLHVIDRAELDLPPARDAVFVDPESGLEVPAAFADVRALYRTTVDAAIAEWRSVLGGVGAAYATVRTDEPFGVPLRRVFARRQGKP
ncbi:MAG: DUF58 domain-containing protein [Gemmatimonadaceae bacterium]